jgi:hypothetical protein
LTKLLSRDESYKYDKPLVFNGMVAGCFFVIASEKVALLGLFDENVFLYYEEDILAWKMYNLSIKCVLNPMAKIIHLGSQTIPINAFSYFHRYRSALYMLKKYAKASNIELSLVYHIYRVSLLSKGLFDKKFIEKYKELKKYYTTLIKNGD